MESNEYKLDVPDTPETACHAFEGRRAPARAARHFRGRRTSPYCTADRSRREVPVFVETCGLCFRGCASAPDRTTNSALVPVRSQPKATGRSAGVRARAEASSRAATRRRFGVDDDLVQRDVLAAHRRLDAAMAYMEREACRVRRGQGARRVIAASESRRRWRMPTRWVRAPEHGRDDQARLRR